MIELSRSSKSWKALTLKLNYEVTSKAVRRAVCIALGAVGKYTANSTRVHAMAMIQPVHKRIGKYIVKLCLIPATFIS